MYASFFLKKRHWEVKWDSFLSRIPLFLSCDGHRCKVINMRFETAFSSFGAVQDGKMYEKIPLFSYFFRNNCSHMKKLH